MLIIPAIDLKDGCVVRFTQGKHDKKVYSCDPLKTAKHWVKQGAKLIHIVDLDGAASGVPKNIGLAKEIAANIEIPVQFGGGVRSIAVISKLLESGVWRVVLGTKAIEDREFLEQAFKKFKDRVIISIDTLSRRLMTKGWQARAKKEGNAAGFAGALKKIGFKEVIFTDISKDGTLKGPNIKEIKSLLKSSGLKIIASGGISSLDDIQRLKLLEKQGVSGVIIGKALYEGKFMLSEAIKLA